MNKIFTDKGFEHYVYWQTQDRKTLKRINELIKSIERDGVGEGAGKPEQLKHDRSSYWSRRIDEKNRLIYRVDENGCLHIVSCRGHYE